MRSKSVGFRPLGWLGSQSDAENELRRQPIPTDIIQQATVPAWGDNPKIRLHTENH